MTTTVLSEREQFLAIREGHLNAAAAQYFGARPQLDNAHNQRIFYAGHCAGYDAALSSPPPVQPVALTDDEIDAIFQRNQIPEDSPWVNYRRFARAIASAIAKQAEAVSATDDTPQEILAARLIDVWVADHKRPIAWAKAVEIQAVVTKMPDAEKMRLLGLDDEYVPTATAEQPVQQWGEREFDEILKQRDHREEVIDALCDAVLGENRPEWSSAYDFADAISDVRERITALTQPLATEGQDGGAPFKATDEMVSRFLAWKLPQDFSPDCGLSETTFHTTPPAPEPQGTAIKDRAAIESACRFIDDKVAPRKCDSDAVSSCWRCKSVYLAKRMREILATTPPSTTQAEQQEAK